jgi:hypothetical protein
MNRLRFAHLLLVLILILSLQSVTAQSRLEVSTGAGLFDGIFLKANSDR